MNCHNVFERRIGALIVLSLVSTVMLAASCGGNDDSKVRVSAPDEEVDRIDAKPRRVPTDVLRDSQALHVLQTVNDAEVEHGTLAQSKASAAGVKEYATQMVTEHGAAAERLSTLAQQRGITPEANPVSETLANVAKTIKARLEGLEGEAFDEAFLDGQLALHVKARKVIDEELTPAMLDPELKSTAAKLRSTIEGHLLQAEKLRTSLDSDAGAGGDAGSSSSGGVGSGLLDGGIQLDGGFGGLGDGGRRDSGLQLPDPDDLLRDL